MELHPNHATAPARRHRRARTPMVAAVALGVLLLGACSSDGDDARPTTTTTAEAPPTTSAKPTTTVGDGPEAPTTTTGDGAIDPWDQDAAAYRDQVGEEVELDCSGTGSEAVIWGVETYTLDSSICTAAVHVGLITFDEGGEVTIEIGTGQDRYEAGTAHDVTSRSYGTFDGSFTFPDAPPGSGEFALAAESWSASAVSLALEVGDEETVACAPDGSIGSAWGTEVYTSDSSICTAAVHAGLITAEEGGNVAVEVVAGEQSYEGSEANGVTTSDYGSYSLSFRFAEQQPLQPGEIEGDPPVGDLDPAGDIEETDLPG